MYFSFNENQYIIMYRVLSLPERSNAYYALTNFICSELNKFFVRKCLNGLWKIGQLKVVLFDNFTLELIPCPFLKEQTSSSEDTAKWIMNNYWLITNQLSKVSMHISGGMTYL